MKRIILSVALLCVLLPAAAEGREAPPAKPAVAKRGPFGLGAIIGEPTGISLKLRLNGSNAIDGGIAWALRNQLFALHADYLLSFPGLIVVQGEDFPPFLGVGAFFQAVGSTGSAGFGVRVPLGACYQFKPLPIEISAEIVPCLVLLPATGFGLQGGLAIRWYF